jgi:hypothetical protein
MAIAPVPFFTPFAGTASVSGMTTEQLREQSGSAVPNPKHLGDPDEYAILAAQIIGRCTPLCTPDLPSTIQRVATRDDVITRLAEVSHATWMLQGIRDAGRTFEGLTIADPVAALDPSEVGEAERRLAAVRDDGRSLTEFSDHAAHQVMRHDVERAQEAVRALEALRFTFD